MELWLYFPAQLVHSNALFRFHEGSTACLTALMHKSTQRACCHCSPSPGMMRSVTVFPASLMRLTMSEWDLLVMEHPFTARMRSPTFSFPQRSAGLPSMIRPILWGMATHAFPAFWQPLTCRDESVCLRLCLERQERRWKKKKGEKEQKER